MGMLQNLKDNFTNGARGLAEVVFPSGLRCYGCGGEILPDTRYGLCERCQPILNDDHICLHCGRPVNNEADYCEHCMHGALGALDQIRSATVYDGIVKKIVRDFKFGRKRYLIEPIAAMMNVAIERFNGKVDCVIPVPILSKILKKRGYNQAALIAERVAAEFHAPVFEALDKVVELHAQARLGAKNRLENVKGCFAFNGKFDIRDLRVLIVDDVMTTGATMDECAHVLTQGKPSSISGLTFATSKQVVSLR